MRIRRRTLKRIIAEAVGGATTLDTKDELMAAVRGQDVEIAMGGSGAVIIVKGGPTYNVEGSMEDLMKAHDYDGTAAIRALKAVARSVHVDEDLKEELGMGATSGGGAMSGVDYIRNPGPGAKYIADGNPEGKSYLIHGDKAGKMGNSRMRLPHTLSDSDGNFVPVYLYTGEEIAVLKADGVRLSTWSPANNPSPSEFM